MARTQSILLFGEGKSEAFFLFHGTYLHTDQNGQVMGRLRNWVLKNFSRELLDEARSRIPTLNEIIHAIEGKVG